MGFGKGFAGGVEEVDIGHEEILSCLAGGASPPPHAHTVRSLSQIVRRFE